MTGPRVLTPGKARRLAQMSTREGIFTILAADHRDSLRAVLAPEDPESVTPSTMTRTKLALLEALAHEASGVMLEPEFNAAQAIGTRALPGSVGFMCALEAQGYLGDPEAWQTSLLDGWSVEKAARLGASGIKLLVLYRPDAGRVTELQDQMISAVIAECARYDVPLFLEPFGYTVKPGLSPDSSEYAAKRRSIVVETVRRLGALGPEVLKVQFPVDTRHEEDRGAWRDACAELDAASPAPWALLSGGDPYELFREQLQVACRAGASGFMVGRALWGEAVTLPPDERDKLAEAELRPRFRELATIAREEGRDWAARSTLPDADETWYLTY
ncbi:MAG: tagatose 1,6-diphosphate aldolase [Egibacteraceae bacterium]